MDHFTASLQYPVVHKYQGAIGYYWKDRVIMERHKLSAIDAEARTATCAICGPTDVYRYKSSNGYGYRCATHMRERNRRYTNLHFANRSSKRHVLSRIDEDAKTAICSTCGVVEIHWRARRKSPPPRPKVAAKKPPFKPRIEQLEENSRIVTEYKRQHCCKRCGTWALDPDKFRFFEAHLPRKQTISMLRRTANPEQLRDELEKRDMYCLLCHWYVLREFSKGIPVPPVKTFTT